METLQFPPLRFVEMSAEVGLKLANLLEQSKHVVTDG